MYKICIILAAAAAIVHGEDEPFSIGLGVLSPSYTQTVGKENVKVNFQQKDNGFSYSVGDPSSGTNTYLNFGPSAAGQAINAAGFADANPSGYAGQSGPSAYQPQGNAAYNGYAGYQAPSYGASSSGFADPSSGFAAPSSGFAAPSSGFAAPSSGFAAPSSGFAAPSSDFGNSGYGAGNAYGDQAGLYKAAPISPNSYVGGSERKPQESSGQIMPAGFSYHGTDGQAFLRKGDSPNFIIGEEQQESSRGLAEQSFYDNLKPAGGSGKILPNGLVGYGPGGARGGSLPVGGYAGPQSAGLFREHGGHNA